LKKLQPLPVLWQHTLGQEQWGMGVGGMQVLNALVWNPTWVWVRDRRKKQRSVVDHSSYLEKSMPLKELTVCIWGCYMQYQASAASAVPTRHSNRKRVSYKEAQAAREKAQKERADAYAEVLLQKRKEKERIKKAAKIDIAKPKVWVCNFPQVMTLDSAIMKNKYA
jgi:hypothetical protein